MKKYLQSETVINTKIMLRRLYLHFLLLVRMGETDNCNIILNFGKLSYDTQTRKQEFVYGHYTYAQEFSWLHFVTSVKCTYH